MPNLHTFYISTQRPPIGGRGSQDRDNVQFGGSDDHDYIGGAGVAHCDIRGRVACGTAPD